MFLRSRFLYRFALLVLQAVAPAPQDQDMNLAVARLTSTIGMIKAEEALVICPGVLGKHG